MAATPLENDQLKRLTRRRRALVAERNRLLCRMQADLQAACPGLLAITPNADNVWFLNLLTHSDDLGKVARLREATLLGIKGIGRTYAARITAWQKSAHFSHDVAWVGPMIIEDARRILELRASIKALEARRAERVAQSEIAQCIDSIPGFALVCG